MLLLALILLLALVHLPSTTSFTFLCQTLPGLEHILFDELNSICSHPSSATSAERLTVHPPTRPGGVVLTSSASNPSNVHEIYPILMHSRVQTKVLLQLSPPTEIEASSDSLYSHVQSSINTDLFKTSTLYEWLNFNVKTTYLSAPPSGLSHSQQTSITIAKAITDLCLTQYDSRPDVDLTDTDVPLRAFISRGENSNNSITMSLWASLISSASSHKLRDYRSANIHAAALKSTTAAALVLRTGWQRLAQSVSKGEKPSAVLLDPMCGSGSFLIEGTQIATDRAPLLKHVTDPSSRPITALRWKSRDQAAWECVVSDAKDRANAGLNLLLDGRIKIMGCDIHPSAHALAVEGLEKVGYGEYVNVDNASCDEYNLDGIKPDDTVIGIVNPPWGIRLDGDLEAAWTKLGDSLKSRPMAGQECWVLSPPSPFSGLLKMKRSSQITFSAANDKLRFIQYHMRRHDGI
jgi:23S rRNA G2445 N2-methylase RlmL